MRPVTAPKSPNRRRVQVYIEENPGCCQQEVATALHLTRNAIAHHIRSLERNQAVSQMRQGRRLLLFPTTVKAPAQRLALGLLRRSTAIAILRQLVVEPSIPWRVLAHRLDLAPHTVRWHVKRLREDGSIVVLPRMTGLGHVVHVHPVVRAHAIATVPHLLGPSPIAPLNAELGREPPATTEFALR